jgi:hypothetical protein
MQPNPMLKKLGLSAEDRAVILHVDDVGMTHTSLDTYRALLDFGLISSASVMVPCPWFPAVADFCQDQGERVDMGIHLTLTSKHSGCRWRPLSTRDPASGLMDETGYFHPTLDAVRKHADPTAVRHEIAVQIERAIAAGIDVTHVDSHRFIIGQHPAFFQAYVEVTLEHKVPPLLIRQSAAILKKMGKGKINEKVIDPLVERLKALTAQGIPTLDGMQILTPTKNFEAHRERIKQVVAALPAGSITYLILHPAKVTAEQRAVRPDWRGRQADLEAFTSEKVRVLFRKEGIQIIGWRDLRDLMRAAG